MIDLPQTEVLSLLEKFYKISKRGNYILKIFTKAPKEGTTRNTFRRIQAPKEKQSFSFVLISNVSFEDTRATMSVASLSNNK